MNTTTSPDPPGLTGASASATTSPDPPEQAGASASATTSPEAPEQAGASASPPPDGSATSPPAQAGTTATSLRIGDVAKLAGTTPRTIRYYEELGLLPEAPARPSGGHRLYTPAEVERLREVIRLKELLGVTLDELRDLLTAEEARAAVRAELRRDDVDPGRRRELLQEALGHINRQLELVEHRSSELAKLREELTETRKRVHGRLDDLGDGVGNEGGQLETTPAPLRRQRHR